MTLEEAISEIHQLKQSLADRESAIEERDNEIAKLQRLLKQAQKNLYGQKSEKLSKDSTQEPLFTFKHEPEQQPLEKVTEVPAHTRRLSKGKKELPSDLERERIEYDLEDKLCKGCGVEMPVIGEEKTEILEHVPAQFKVIEHVRFKRACSCCKTGVFTPKLPPTVQPLERAQPGPGLLAHIILSKYMDHLPLYRQEQMFARQRIELSRKKMCDWIAGACDLLSPLWQELKREMLALRYLQADETTIKVQDHEERDGKLHTGYFWTLHSPERRLAVFEYYASRAGECAKDLFQGFEGTAQTDYYAGYNKVLLPGTVRRLACLAHVRRKFIEAQSSAKSECGKVLELIAKLYHFEAQWKGLSPPERKAKRQKEARHILQKLRDYLVELQTKALPRAPLSESLTYTLSQWDVIELYLEDGTFEIDNNGVERQIRPIAIGRKNYLFAGSHDGARRAAMLYSLLATCKLHKVNAFEWLRDVLVRVHDRDSKLGDLLPHRWKVGQAKPD